MDRWCTLGTKGSSAVGLGTGGERVDGSWRLSLKRRKTTGRYRVRTKEVMDDSATENPDVSSTEVDKTLTDTHVAERPATQGASTNKCVVEDTEQAATTGDREVVPTVEQTPEKSKTLAEFF